MCYSARLKVGNLKVAHVQQRPKQSKIAKIIENCFFHNFCQLWSLVVMRAVLYKVS